MQFDYFNAFSRNLGFISKEEQNIIASKKIGIPGMGGVGGHHLHSLLRFGFKNFHIADLDYFEEHNFNRQIGAKVSTINKPKVEVMFEMAKDINPDCNIKIFDHGVSEENLEEFLDGIDYLVDGLDVYVIRTRIKLFEIAHKKGIPIITAAPLGIGTSIISFHPKKMSFAQYFDMNEKMSDKELLIKFLAGLNPKPLMLKYLRHKNLINLDEGRAPSLHGGVLAATTAIASTIYKLALGHGDIVYAPKSLQYDFYLNTLKKNWIPFGNKNPRQKILMKFIEKEL